MRKKISNKKLFLILIIPVFIVFNILSCTILYFIEPIDYAEPDFLHTSYSFELYKKYSYDNNPDFYIKQISADDIVSFESDKRLKYIDDTIMIICKDGTVTSEVTSLIAPYNGKICGYISILNLYQVEFPDSDYEYLVNICSEYNESDFVTATCVDYFEETPPSDYETEEYTDYEYFYDNYYKDIINYPENIECNSDVVVGIFDSLVDKENNYFNIINADTYDRKWLDDPQYLNTVTHGSHVAGIACCSSDSDAPAIYPDGRIVSDNAFNNSISYWIAAITDMIVNYNTKAINVSMGYNSFITASANLGCENALDYIENESLFFESFVEKLIDADYEFILCFAAGNDSGMTINKIPSAYFSYGEKKLLNKLDLFNIYTKKIRYADAKYSLPFTYIENEKIRDHIIVVASCDSKKRFTGFSDAGESVDMVAPGEDILSFVLNNEYEICSGTSMAAPFVTGTAAMIFSYDNSLTAGEVKDILLKSATEYVNGYGFEYPLLNVAQAITFVTE